MSNRATRDAATLDRLEAAKARQVAKIDKALDALEAVKARIAALQSKAARP